VAVALAAGFHHTMLSRMMRAIAVGYTVVAVLGMVLFARRWHRASRRERRILRVPIACLGTTAILYAAWQVQIAIGAAAHPTVPLTEIMQYASITAVPVSFLFGLARQRYDQAAVAHLVRELAGLSPAGMQAALARAVGDPDLRLAFPSATGYLTPSGEDLRRSGDGRDRRPGQPDHARRVRPQPRRGADTAGLGDRGGTPGPRQRAPTRSRRPRPIRSAGQWMVADDVQGRPAGIGPCRVRHPRGRRSAANPSTG
jgi:hypothetical protein